MIKNQYYTLYICLSDHDFKPRSIFFCSMKIKFLNINIFINFVSLPGKSLIKSEKLCIPRNNTRNFLLIIGLIKENLNIIMSINKNFHIVIVPLFIFCVYYGTQIFRHYVDLIVIKSIQIRQQNFPICIEF